MGERGRAVVVQDGETRYHYIKTSSSLPVRLEYGPAVLDSLHEWDREEDYWIEADTWSEWAIAADFDRKQLVFYGPQDWSWSFEYREDRIAMIAPAWPGWTVVSADHGIDSIAEFLGLPMPLLGGMAPDSEKTRELFRTSVGQELTYEDSYLITTTQGGEERAFAGTSWGLVREWLPFVEASEVLAVASSATSSFYMAVTPNAGAHIDADSGKFYHWSGYVSRPNPEIDLAGSKDGFDRIHVPVGLSAHLKLLSLPPETSFSRDRTQRITSVAIGMLWGLEVEARKRAWPYGGTPVEPQPTDWPVDPAEARNRIEVSLAAVLGSTAPRELRAVLLGRQGTPREYIDHLFKVYGKG